MDNTKRLIVLLLIGAIIPLKMATETIGGPNDFSYFWHAARSALYGSPTTAWFPYPPHALFLYLPFAPLPFHAAWAVFNFYGLALFVLAARPYMPKGFPPVSAICTPAVLICVLFGQTGLVVGALWLWAFRGRWQAVALLTFKPHLGILSALSLSRRTLLPTVICRWSHSSSRVWPCFRNGGRDSPTSFSGSQDRSDRGQGGITSGLGRRSLTASSSGLFSLPPLSISSPAT